MTPLDLIGWAIAIGLAWGILVTFIPVERWIDALLASLKKRRDKSPNDSEPSDPSAG